MVRDKIFHSSRKKTGGSEPSESTASSRGGLSVWSHFRHSQKSSNAGLRRGKARTLHKREKKLSTTMMYKIRGEIRCLWNSKRFLSS